MDNLNRSVRQIFSNSDDISESMADHNDKFNRILVLFAHPALHYSKINIKLIKAYEGLENVTFRDLYALHPRFLIDAYEEQLLLLEHDIIVFHYPMHWYSMPALMKQWQEIVLTTNFIFGVNNNDKGRHFALKDKKMLNVITTGTSEKAFSEEGVNKHPLTDYLVGMKQTSLICRMQFLPPFVVHGTRQINDIKQIEKYTSILRLTMQTMKRYDENDFNNLSKYTYINDDVSFLIE